MTRLLALLVVLALFLVPAVSAKELSRATVCGAGGCKTVTVEARPEQLQPGGGGESLPAPPPTADFFTVEFQIEGTREESRFTFLYVPSKAIIGANRELSGSLTWVPVHGKAIEEMTIAIGDLKPYAAPAAWPGDADAVPTEPDGTDWPLVTGSLVVGLALAAVAIARRSRALRILPRTG